MKAAFLISLILVNHILSSQFNNLPKIFIRFLTISKSKNGIVYSLADLQQELFNSLKPGEKEAVKRTVAQCNSGFQNHALYKKDANLGALFHTEANMEVYNLIKKNRKLDSSVIASKIIKRLKKRHPGQENCFDVDRFIVENLVKQVIKWNSR